MIKNCEHCNKAFITNHKLKKYCDMTCQMKANEARVNVKRKEITRLKNLSKNAELVKS